MIRPVHTGVNCLTTPIFRDLSKMGASGNHPRYNMKNALMEFQVRTERNGQAVYE